MTGASLGGMEKGLLMAWETKGQIFYARVNSAKTLLPPSEIRAATQGKWPVALAAPDGTLLLSWKNGSTLFWQLHDAADKPVGSVQSKPSPNPNRHAGVVTAAGDFLLID
jgi:hypothetical protein